MLIYVARSIAQPETAPDLSSRSAGGFRDAHGGGQKASGTTNSIRADLTAVTVR